MAQACTFPWTSKKVVAVAVTGSLNDAIGAKAPKVALTSLEPTLRPPWPRRNGLTLS